MKSPVLVDLWHSEPGHPFLVVSHEGEIQAIALGMAQIDFLLERLPEIKENWPKAA